MKEKLNISLKRDQVLFRIIKKLEKGKRVEL